MNRELNRNYPHRPLGITRRGLLVGAGAGVLAGLPLGWLAQKGWHAWQETSPFQGRTVEVERPAYGMPGPFPGRVVEVHHPGAVNARNEIQANTVAQMIHRGMCDLTGADYPEEAWQRFFQRDDVVGIKVNPVGRSRKPGQPASISSPEVLIEVVKGLRSAGVPARNIILFERYADEFREAGYDTLMRTRPLEGTRWFASSAKYTETQLAIDGLDDTSERDRHVVGYDPDVFVSMGYAHTLHSRRDERRFQSHVSAIITRMVNKIINIPCLKDHRSAGVTLALKNMSHGMNNNVARSHLSGYRHNHGQRSSPNQCNTFIPTAVAQEPIRRKATLHIMDGLIGVYEGGPGSWNETWGTWRRKSLFFATDPVALDHVCWDIIDTRRALEGWRPVAHMSMLSQAPHRTFSPRLAALALATPEAAAAALLEHQRRMQQGNQEDFDRRQPEHVILAGTMGLGVWNAEEIEHRVRRLT